jgi:hypothetical protein
MKKSQKYFKNTSMCVEPNGVKFFKYSFIYYTLRALEPNKKEKKNWPVELLVPTKILNSQIFENF